VARCRCPIRAIAWRCRHRRQDIDRRARLGHGALREAIPIGPQARLEYEAFRNRPGILCIGASLGVGKPGIRQAGKSRLPYQSSIRAERLDFRALSGLRKDQRRDVEAGGELMRSVPMARRGGHARDGLQASAALMQALEIVAARAVNEEDEGLRTLRRVIKHAAVRGHTELKERVVQPYLVFQGDKRAALIGIDSRRLRIERVQSEVAVVAAVIEKAGAQMCFGERLY